MALTPILEQYALFECKTKVIIQEVCAPYCSTCKKVCCHTDFCRESKDSLFLRLVRQRYPQKERYNAASGWLHAYGCALDVGRPPACYEFICNAILDAQPTAYHKYIVKVLSFLVSYLGRNCCGHRHLVELNTMESLLQVNYERFSKRLSLAEKALHECADFLHQSHYSFSPHCATKILASPKSVAYVTQAARSVSA